VVLMRSGRIEQQAAPAEIYARPATAFASSFIGSANLVPVTVGVVDGRPVAAWAGAVIPLAAGTPGEGTLMLRQEDVVLH
ncbi:spermidine/putrescine ABC transporter ATP-binding protein, partial [Mycobacterium tuberculosis]|nr:spermidine/putrescine ABC transporter ATP-binding protein [Mycobacterium tuberculosis]